MPVVVPVLVSFVDPLSFANPKSITLIWLDSVTIIFEDCAGIAENNQSRQVQVVPNPNNGSFRIRFDLEINDPVDITVFSPVSGNVFERANAKVDQMNVLDVNLDQVSGGIYFLKISNEEVNILKKIIVQQ